LDAAANGSAGKDFIHFNIADQSEAGRTITINSQLPNVSSNLVIDGSTQYGNKFGVSDAKVALFCHVPLFSGFYGLMIAAQQDVEIYGLYIKNVTDMRSQTITYFDTGIQLQSCKNIQIGAAGKGNVVVGFGLAMAINWSLDGSFLSEDVKIKANFFDIEADGTTLSLNNSFQVSIESVVGELYLGGTDAERNVFAQGLLIIQYNNPESTGSWTKPAVITIKNNNIGVDYSGRTSTLSTHGIRSTTDSPHINTLYIEDNVISVKNGEPAIFLYNYAYPVSIIRNYIGIDRSKQITLPAPAYGIFLYNGEYRIGSNNPADANFITGCQPVHLFGYATGAAINKNSFFCVTNLSPLRSHRDVIRPVPKVSISKVTNSLIEGMATPLSTIELFYSDNCGAVCAPKTYFASVNADASGNWEYNAPTSGTVIASATLNTMTSEFTSTRIEVDKIEIISTCDGFGSIRGAQVSGAADIKWVDEHGTTRGTQIDLVDVPAGKYKLIVSNGFCGDETTFYTIQDESLKIDITQMHKTNASCSQADGSITGIMYLPASVSSFIWTNSAGSIVGDDIDLLNVPAGSYFLTIKSEDNSCEKVYGPIALINTTGPNINQSSATIKPTNCGQSVGSITGITVTGTGVLKYSWTNQLNQQVGTNKDLLNKPAGKYILRVTDDTQCGPVYTTALEILEMNGITLDESAMQITIASCSNANGSVTGIKAQGATRYKWTDINNQTKSNDIDLQNVAPGDYTFTASNSFGCEQIRTYHIGQQAATIYPVFASNIINACYGINNGSISISPSALVKSLRWTNNQDITIDGTGNTIDNLAPGTYKLYLTDINGCESFYNGYTVTKIPELKILGGQISDDECDLKTGSIKNAQVTGGAPPYTYSWFNSANTPLASSLDIGDLASGTYRLVVTDSRNCAQSFVTYTVQNSTSFVAAPSANDIQVCSPGKIVLAVNNASSAYVYRLYESVNSPLPLEERADGRFTIDAKSNTHYFVSQLSGTCESSRTPVRVTVGISSLDIANAFTPNADGINDVWKITGIENSPSATVQVFNRSGQLVFNSKGYTTPFNGTANGRDLPVGNYYYIINMGSACSILSGTITIIR
jgi:gliding motility-associated-like protein